MPRNGTIVFGDSASVWRSLSCYRRSFLDLGNIAIAIV
jgi:hypothetical protein